MTDPPVPRRWRMVSWVRRHPWRAAGLTLLAGFIVLNLLAYRHAGAMLTYSPEANRTPTAHSLSAWQKAKVLVCGVTVPRPENSRAPTDLGLPSETVHFAADDGVHLEGWLITPAKPRGTILLFPGYAAPRSSLLPEGKAFHDLGYAALLVDFRGAAAAGRKRQLDGLPRG